MTKTSLEWGEYWFDKEHALMLICPNSECKRSHGSYINVGHSEIAVGVRKSSSDENYILTCKCPECYTKYWFHIDVFEAEKLSKERESKLEEGANL